MVRFENVSMIYPGGDARAIDNMSFTIEDGEFVFLVGPSGSGKTSIIKLITGEREAGSGKVTVNGFDLRNMRRRKLPAMRRTIGVIFQDFRLIEDKTVYENVAFAMHVVGASNREIRRRVPYVLDLVGLSGRERRYPREISGGEQQRVAVARAIAPKPRFLFADEPTSEQDSATGLQVLKVFQELAKETTVVITTHDEVIASMADCVFAMEDGKLI